MTVIKQNEITPSVYKTLTVYKASAGSGKTFTLATQFIKLIIENPYSYRTILAVTFTNKATEEMKIRILSQLYGIANHLEDSEQYLKHVMMSTELSEAQVRERARQALGLLLHNYNYFHVETIDKFFQRVLRNLASELDLTPNLKIELNDKQVMEKAVDDLIEELKPNSPELNWILNFINQKIDANQSWSVMHEIKKFGNNIFKDVYKEYYSIHQKKVLDDAFYQTFIKDLKYERQQIKTRFEVYYQRFEQILKQHGATIDDLTRKSTGPAGYFLKLKNEKYSSQDLDLSTYQNAMENSENWVNKAQRNDPSWTKLCLELTDLMKEAESNRKEWYRTYKSVDITLKYLTQFRLLDGIENKVRDLNSQSNSFLLSDTQTLLHSLIKDSDTPFIFEKIGTRLKHIMIDEFQDTSTVQWKNFKILLQECMSMDDGSNLIVGDVKQSIYRWRSGDWRLLNNIENEFSPQQQSMLQLKPLQTNYRSLRRIIEFNNAFFQISTDLECQALSSAGDIVGEAQMRKAYHDVEQVVPDGRTRQGLVSIKLLPKEDYVETTLNEITGIVSRLFQQGAKESNIAILVRTNKYIPQMADRLMQQPEHFKVVSDEAFRLDASLAVNILIDALHGLVHPENILRIAHLAKAYQNQICGKLLSDNELFVHPRRLSTEPIEVNQEQQKKDDYQAKRQREERDHINQWLPSAYCGERYRLLSIPIIDCVERLYAIFELEKLSDQSAYVSAFYDLLNQYLTDNLADIDDFLLHWDESLHATNIQSDSIEGIRIMTIHKSKGLEFNHVIIPFCDWKLEMADTLWCVPHTHPFDELPLLPISFSKTQMSETIFESDYVTEHLQNTVDNMNLLYVAFTRAVKNLFVIAKRKQGGSRSAIIEDSLEMLHDQLEDSQLEGDFKDSKDTLRFEYGRLEFEEEKEKIATQNVFLIPPENKDVTIQSYDAPIAFKQSNQSRTFVSQEDDEDDPQQGYIRLGNILHQLFSRIMTVTDIEPVLREFEQDGILYDELITHEKLQEMLQKRLNNPKVAEWFSDKWQLFNECSILHVDPVTNEVQVHRPDRVMTDGQQMVVVDFKFGKPREKYHDQVLQYMLLLKEMGYQNIKGYLWYVYTNQIEEVNE